MHSRRPPHPHRLLPLLTALACLAWVALGSRAEATFSAEPKQPRERAASPPMQRSSAGAWRPPNILILLTDDQRKRGTMHVMDQTRRLFARGGVGFNSAFVTTPQCSPSRASLLTGQYTHNHGVLDNPNGRNLDHDETIQRYLNDHGYRTGFFGKFPNRGHDARLPHFDESFLGFSPDHARYDRRQDSFVAGKATRFLRRANRGDDARPWLMVVAFRSPHLPTTPQGKYRDARVGRFQPNPATQETDFSDKNPALANAQGPISIARRHSVGQKRMLLSVDDAVGRIFDSMRRMSERDTLSVYTSDNGYYWGEHGLRAKYLPYLESLRVPLYMRWPGKLRANSVDPRLAANIDIAPTIFDATRISPGHQVDGSSLLRPGERDWLMFEGAPFSNKEGWPAWRRAYYDESTHYFRWLDDFEELYDLDEDPWELENVASEQPGRVAEVRAAIEAAEDCAGAACP